VISIAYSNHAWRFRQFGVATATLMRILAADARRERSLREQPQM